MIWSKKKKRRIRIMLPIVCWFPRFFFVLFSAPLFRCCCHCHLCSAVHYSQIHTSHFRYIMVCQVATVKCLPFFNSYQSKDEWNYINASRWYTQSVWFFWPANAHHIHLALDQTKELSRKINCAIVSVCFPSQFSVRLSDGLDLIRFRSR